MQFKKHGHGRTLSLQDFPEPDGDFLKFCEMPLVMRRLPAGKIVYADGMTIFIDGAGTHMSQAEFEKKYGYDPGPVLDRMHRLGVECR